MSIPRMVMHPHSPKMLHRLRRYEVIRLPMTIEHASERPVGAHRLSATIETPTSILLKGKQYRSLEELTYLLGTAPGKRVPDLWTFWLFRDLHNELRPLTALRDALALPRKDEKREPLPPVTRLFDAGLVRPLQILLGPGATPRLRACLLADGRVTVDGQPYPTLDAAAAAAWTAAHAVTAGIVDGWAFWHVRDETGAPVSLASLVRQWRGRPLPQLKRPSFGTLELIKPGQSASPARQSRDTRPDPGRPETPGERTLPKQWKPVTYEEPLPDPGSIPVDFAPGTPPYRVVLYDEERTAWIDSHHERYVDAAARQHLLAASQSERPAILDATGRRV